MKMMTKTIEARFAKVGRQEDAGDGALVIAKFFTPWSHWTWYATEYDPKTRTFFGYVDGLEGEYGYFSLDELAEVRGPAGLKIERDLYWTERPVREVEREREPRAIP